MSDTNVHRVVGNLLVGTSHFFVDTTTNQVGINTSSPSASLDVATGDVKVGSGITLANDGTITATGGFSGDGSGLSGVNSDSGSWVNGSSSNIHLAVSTDNVGIGVLDPSHKLDVHGDINISSGTLKVGGTPAVFSNWSVDGSDIYRSSGNVGIVTATPMTKLDIECNAAQPSIVFSDTSNSRYQTGIGSIHISGQGQRLDFYTGDSGANGTLLTNSPRMSITGTGNMLISGYIQHKLISEAAFVWDPMDPISVPNPHSSTIYDANGDSSYQATMYGMVNRNTHWDVTGNTGRIQTNNTVNMRRDWTIVVWHRFSSTSQSGLRIAGHGRTSGSKGLHIMASGSTSVRFGMYGNDVDFGTVSHHQPTKTWCQYAFTYDHNSGNAGTNKKAYQNQRKVADDQANFGDPTHMSGNNGGSSRSGGFQPYSAEDTEFRIGQGYSDAVSMTGATTENSYGPILLFWRVLTETEIRALHSHYRKNYNGHDK
jgi:hypothetical protein